MYWTMNKLNQEPEIHSNLRNVSESIGVPYDSLAYEFSRKKAPSFENDLFYVEKAEDANLAIKAYSKKIKDLESDVKKVGSMQLDNGSFVELYIKESEG